MNFAQFLMILSIFGIFRQSAKDGGSLDSVRRPEKKHCEIVAGTDFPNRAGVFPDALDSHHPHARGVGHALLNQSDCGDNLRVCTSPRSGGHCGGDLSQNRART